MDKVTINNQVVSMRKFVKQAKTHVINKCVKQIKLLQNRKGNEAQVLKCKRKAERMLSEVSIIKKIKPDFISKMALTKAKDWKSVLLQKNLPLEERSVAVLANYGPVQNEVEKFYKVNSNLIPRLGILFDSIGSSQRKDKHKMNQSKNSRANTKVIKKPDERTGEHSAIEEKNENKTGAFGGTQRKKFLPKNNLSNISNKEQTEKGQSDLNINETTLPTIGGFSTESDDENGEFSAIVPKNLRSKSVQNKSDKEILADSDKAETNSESEKNEEINFKSRTLTKKLKRNINIDQLTSKKNSSKKFTTNKKSEEVEAQSHQIIFKNQKVQSENVQMNMEEIDSEKLAGSNSCETESEDENESQQETKSLKLNVSGKLNKISSPFETNSSASNEELEEKRLTPCKPLQNDNKLSCNALDIQVKLQAIADNAKYSTSFVPKLNPELKLSVEERNKLKSIKVLNLEELQDLDEISVKDDTSSVEDAEETSERKKDPFFLTADGDAVSESDDELETNKQQASDFPPFKSKKYNSFDRKGSKPQHNSYHGNKSNFADTNYRKDKGNHEFNDKSNFKRKSPENHDGFRKNKKFPSFESNKFGDRTDNKPFNKGFKAGNFMQKQSSDFKNQGSNTSKKMNDSLNKDEKPMHPSWEAKRKLKDAAKTKFKGKRIVFDS